MAKLKKKRLDFVMNRDNRDNRNEKIENVGFIELETGEDTNEPVNMYIYGDIVSSKWDKSEEEDKCPQDIVDFLADVDNNADLTVYINSGGGNVFAGIGIYNILKRHKGHISGVVDGMAASVASVILMACDDIKVSTGAQIMIHKPSTFGWGNVDDFNAVIARLNKCQDMITDIYMEKALEGVERDTITEKINAETWMSGAEAAELFNVEIDQQPAVAACASYMTDHYKHMPKDMNIESVEDAARKKQQQEEIDDILNDLYMYGI